MASMVVTVAVMEADLTVTGIMVKGLTVIDHMVTEVGIAQALTAEAEAEAEVEAPGPGPGPGRLRLELVPAF